MPGRNSIREYAPNSFYHIYNRGVNKQTIFEDESDYTIFLSLLKRYLSNEHQTSRHRHLYPNYSDSIELLAFCLMPNHFHLLIYQRDNSQILTKLLQSTCTAYAMYFNRKYRRVGPLFQGRFKASRIASDEYLQHVSRYIHLNPKDYQIYQWSSMPYYRGVKHASWIMPQRILDMFEANSYLKFVEDHKDHKATLDEVKQQLAGFD